MSKDIVIRDALRRRKIFEDLEENLGKVKSMVLELDPQAEVYLFGSVAEGRHTLSSDIDILIITEKNPWELRAQLLKRGITDPYELHIHPPKMLETYRRRGRLIKL